MKRSLLCALLLSNPLFATFPPDIAGQIRLRAHRGELASALSQYIHFCEEKSEHDYSLLQDMCCHFLLSGSKSEDPNIYLMSLFGAGVSQSQKLLKVLEEGVQSNEINKQLISLNFLSHYEDDAAQESLKNALSSNYLMTRLEACFQLAQRGDPIVVDHLQALYHKVPVVVHALYPQILVHIDTPSSNQMLRQFLSHSNFLVRTETIMHLAKAKRDEFLPQIRKLATQKQFAQLEASIYALGEMGDSSSLPLLEELSESKQMPIRLAALIARYKLEDPAAFEPIMDEARSGNLYAIFFLGHDHHPESLQLLNTLAQAAERNIQLNALCALLARQAPPPKSLIETFLFSDEKAWGFAPASSPSGSLQAGRVTSLIGIKKENDPILQKTKEIKVQMLGAALELEESFFFSLAKKVFDEKTSYLVPPLVAMLANHHTSEAIDLLKEMSQKAGAPLIRNFCNLALFQLNEEGPYESKLLDWVKGERQHQIIKLQQEKSPERESAHSLSADETSSFYLSVLEAIAQKQSENGIRTLLEIIEEGDPINRYALAGLLIRITE
jgi:HEAT repeat protein